MRSIIIHSAAKRRRRSNVKTKMTKAERNWVLYDVGNSAFVLLVSTIMPIYLTIWLEMQDFLLSIILRIGGMRLLLQQSL